MKKTVIILLTLLSTLSIAYAIYENAKTRSCQHKAATKEIALNEKIRLLEDSLANVHERLEMERKSATEARKTALDLFTKYEKEMAGKSE
ncbi:hypothetical protein C900_02321 [Fulvivirga imtechensis AK7]|uniref:Uncharacterized protein n=1 Tax=Fulvivirga imtechensis AK7 TaxID=1237149 RepID=L8JS14_9BACT|nr:hypothetical protein [Fulvivirga imtechensis]ELR71736.1 hypothetical protein C900_02321 [Fulvivirga imtechensis AK7]